MKVSVPRPERALVLTASVVAGVVCAASWSRLQLFLLSAIAAASVAARVAKWTAAREVLA